MVEYNIRPFEWGDLAIELCCACYERAAAAHAPSPPVLLAWGSTLLRYIPDTALPDLPHVSTSAPVRVNVAVP